MAVTIKDIAKYLNISYATVSRALNNRYGVNEETRQKVLEAARNLRYHPNASARELVSKKNNIIGLILPDIENPFFPEVASNIIKTAAEYGYTVFLCITDWDLDQQTAYIETLIENRVEGLIISPIEQSNLQIQSLLGSDIPVVYVSEAQQGDDCSYVAIDNFRGARLATSHLIDRGFGPVYYFGAVADKITNDERFAGYQAAMEDHQINPDPKWVHMGDYYHRTGYVMIRDLIARKEIPRSVFAINDQIALGIIQGVRESNLRVPEDVAVVGFDNIPMAAFPEIQLTTIAQPKSDLGKIAMDVLWHLIQNGPESKPERILLPTQLIIRKSSGG
jgi:LacI family transcriptional regulator